VHLVLSELEKRFLQLVREAGLPLPKTNKVVDAHRVDCRWPDHTLTVELDSYRFHNTRYSWQQGYERERAPYARRDRYRRYTWRDVFETAGDASGAPRAPRRSRGGSLTPRRSRRTGPQASVPQGPPYSP